MKKPMKTMLLAIPLAAATLLAPTRAEARTFACKVGNGKATSYLMTEEACAAAEQAGSKVHRPGASSQPAPAPLKPAAK